MLFFKLIKMYGYKFFKFTENKMNTHVMCIYICVCVYVIISHSNQKKTRRKRYQQQQQQSLHIYNIDRTLIEYNK